MQLFEVTMGGKGGGTGTFKVQVNASTPEQAKRAAEAQNPEFKAQAVKTAR
jgi:hypothetical protein